MAFKALRARLSAGQLAFAQGLSKAPPLRIVARQSNAQQAVLIEAAGEDRAAGPNARKAG